ncbi:hypothetical protein GbCGDNIH4_7243 [Granulibacter bethesdensis CGDNIH4]|nr:hypothetical protein GbCGDNIH4_7243 [Granulibacter bethesdensis CGDNIH4]
MIEIYSFHCKKFCFIKFHAKFKSPKRSIIIIASNLNKQKL